MARVADREETRLRVVRDRADHVVAALQGDLTSTTAPAVLKSLTKLLLRHGRVLLDVTGTRLVWPPAPELFASALAAAGGWPAASLVLIGADPHTTDRLRACRVIESVPLATTEADAAALATLRPARLVRSAQFPAHPSAVARARAFVGDVCRAWEIPAVVGRVATIVDELATAAVRPSGNGFRVVLVLQSGRLRVSVRDARPAPELGARPSEAETARQARLWRIAAHCDTWGVLRYDGGTSVWALLQVRDPADAASTAPARTRPRPHRPDPPATMNGTRSRQVLADPAAAIERRDLLTYDLEQAHELLSSTYSRHTVGVTGDREQFRFRFSAVATSTFAVERVAHSLTGLGQFEPWDDVLVASHDSGRCRISTGSCTLDATVDDVMLLEPGVEHEVRWSDTRTEVVRLDAKAIAEIAAEVCGIDTGAVRFELAQPVSAQRGRHWRALMRALDDGVLSNDAALASPLSRSTIFRHLATTLIETFPNPALNALRSEPSGPSWVEPAVVRRAAQFIAEHSGEDIGLGDIARAARVGPRALQLAFRRYRDVTPLEHLRRVRLERAHHDLLAADPSAGDTVATIATRWGFAHHGYFASSYRRIYGHSPNVTLRS